ncbi:MAG: replication-associated recombination protein A [Erysipelotrichaceae bacterium]|nr:replication-associated recombination protein A [Erysipelotrichaceae bacterium]
MDLFAYAEENYKEKEAPLASRMRPRTLDEIVGQEHILGKGKLLYRAIQADQLSSVIFYGPPGVGKTTLAKVIANTTSADFHQVNATIAGKKDLEDVVNIAKSNLGGYRRRTILFIDEIHRFNKAQQDYLLPFVEDGTVILIGATTENPYFEVNGALLSRSRIFELKPLSKENVLTLIHRSFEKDYGLKKYNADITEEAANFLAEISDGDARAALNAIELAAMTTERSEDGMIHITLEVAEECIQRKAIRYDKSGDNHYDTIAAFIESLCGSDPDAAVYYLARMLTAGEDVKFIARRMLIAASEEVGNADPMAICVAASAAMAVERVGMPEGRIILAQAAAYIASAPKSNASYLAIEKAFRIVNKTGNLPIPPYLQDSSYKSAAKLGRGVGYKYAHNYPNHFVQQQYLPDLIKDIPIYEPNDIGQEKNIKDYFRKIGKNPERYRYKNPALQGNMEKPWTDPDNRQMHKVNKPEVKQEGVKTYNTIEEVKKKLNQK